MRIRQTVAPDFGRSLAKEVRELHKLGMDRRATSLVSFLKAAAMGTRISDREAPMQPMSTFDPDRPCLVHDHVVGKTFDWHTGWASNYRQYATDKFDGTVWWDGLVLDGWEPAK